MDIVNLFTPKTVGNTTMTISAEDPIVSAWQRPFWSPFAFVSAPYCPGACQKVGSLGPPHSPHASQLAISQPSNPAQWKPKPTP